MKPKEYTEKQLRRLEKTRKAKEDFNRRLTIQQANDVAAPTLSHLNQLSEALSGKPLRQRRAR
jgi:hypothetical protein